jgi:hypothetical protein
MRIRFSGVVQFLSIAAVVVILVFRATTADASVIFGEYTYNENTDWTLVSTNCDYCSGPPTYTGLSGLQVVVENGTTGSGGYVEDAVALTTVTASAVLTVDPLGKPLNWQITWGETLWPIGWMSAVETNAGSVLDLNYLDFSDGFNGLVTTEYAAPPGSWSVSGLVLTPLPAALPLFGTGLGALGLLGWRRKRRSYAAAA